MSIGDRVELFDANIEELQTQINEHFEQFEESVLRSDLFGILGCEGGEGCGSDDSDSEHSDQGKHLLVMDYLVNPATTIYDPEETPIHEEPQAPIDGLDLTEIISTEQTEELPVFDPEQMPHRQRYVGDPVS